MLQILINFVFKLLEFVANIILYPVIVIFNAFIPGFGDTLNAFGHFIYTGVSVIPFIMYMFNIPEAPFTVFFVYITGKYTFYLGYVVMKFTLRIYNYFKP